VCLLSSSPDGFVPSPQNSPLGPPSLNLQKTYTFHPASESHTWNSDDEAKTDIEADVEKGMYTAEMDPKLGPKTLTDQEAARQRAAANALKASLGTTSASGFTTSSSDVSSDFGNSIISSRVSSPQQSRQGTPVNSDDEEEMTEDQKRLAENAKKRAVPRCTSAPGTRLPQKKSAQGESGGPAARSRAAAGPSPTQDPDPKKAAASQQAPAGPPKPTKEQQAPKQPMTTRRRAQEGSRAGGFRPGVGGSGQTDTCVASSHPSQT
jgi:hypothetical protein